jgi:hypothetical protein
LMVCLFVCSIAGVLVSPATAVHRHNQDYHAAFHKSLAERRSIDKLSGSVGSAAEFWRARYTAVVIEQGTPVAVPAGYFSHFTIIETLRLLL